jgi:hypothetical protein
MDKEVIKALAMVERLMDEGKMPFVMAPLDNGKLERLAVSPECMKEFGLVQGQTINSIILDELARWSLKSMKVFFQKMMNRAMEEKSSEDEDEFEGKLTGDFDFRSMLGSQAKKDDEPNKED